jgi:hypothetical protein
MLLVSCGSDGEEGDTEAGQPVIPLVLVTFEDFHECTELPWTVRGISPDSSASFGMLATDHTSTAPDIVRLLTDEAAAGGRLMLLVDCPRTDPVPGQRESMRVLTGPDSLPLVTEPEGIATELGGLDWSDPVERQLGVIRLMSINLPDLVVVRTSGLDTGTAIEVCRIWLEQTLPGRLRVAFYSPPGSDSARGWIVLAGAGIGSVDILGMTPLDCLATLRVLSGLPWNPSIAEGIPGLAVMTVPPDFLREVRRP